VRLQGRDGQFRECQRPPRLPGFDFAAGPHRSPDLHLRGAGVELEVVPAERPDFLGPHALADAESS
jgi:hypothetical protein